MLVSLYMLSVCCTSNALSIRCVKQTKDTYRQKRAKHLKKNIASLRVSVNKHLGCSSDNVADQQRNVDTWEIISENAKHIRDMYLELKRIEETQEN